MKQVTTQYPMILFGVVSLVCRQNFIKTRIDALHTAAVDMTNLKASAHAEFYIDAFNVTNKILDNSANYAAFTSF